MDDDNEEISKINECDESDEGKRRGQMRYGFLRGQPHVHRTYTGPRRSCKWVKTSVVLVSVNTFSEECIYNLLDILLNYFLSKSCKIASEYAKTKLSAINLVYLNINLAQIA